VQVCVNFQSATQWTGPEMAVTPVWMPLTPSFSQTLHSLNLQSRVSTIPLRSTYFFNLNTYNRHAGPLILLPIKDPSHRQHCLSAPKDRTDSEIMATADHQHVELSQALPADNVVEAVSQFLSSSFSPELKKCG